MYQQQPVVLMLVVLIPLTQRALLAVDKLFRKRMIVVAVLVLKAPVGESTLLLIVTVSVV
jgi:hypothetical protein